jgi:formate-dependent nitrite reductase membrane component NrfD
MDSIVLMQSKWGATFNIPWYLFLGGMSGGILIVASVTELLGGKNPKYHALSGLSALLVLPFMVIGGLALTFHLGKPERGFFFPLYMSNYASWLTIGGWIIGIFVPLSIAMAMAWYYEIDRKLRVFLALIGVPVGILMCFYTGNLLAAAKFVPLWAWQFLPVLFLLSGLSTGLAVCAINAYVVRYIPFPPRARDRIVVMGLEDTAPVLGLYDIGVLILEMIWLALFLVALTRGGVGHQYVAKALMSGSLANWFWVGVVIVGMALPLALGVLEPIFHRLKNSAVAGWSLFAKLHLVLIGGLVLRYVIVWGGDISQPLVYTPTRLGPPKAAAQGSPQALNQALRIINRR